MQMKRYVNDEETGRVNVSYIVVVGTYVSTSCETWSKSQMKTKLPHCPLVP
jgi:hypothetical protein